MFKPCIRYVLIQRDDCEKEESLIALPEGVFKNESIYEKVRIEAISCDIRPPLAAGQEVVVLTKMIEEVEFDNQVIYLVLENYILGITEKTND